MFSYWRNKSNGRIYVFQDTNDYQGPEWEKVTKDDYDKSQNKPDVVVGVSYSELDRLREIEKAVTFLIADPNKALFSTEEYEHCCPFCDQYSNNIENFKHEPNCPWVTLIETIKPIS